MSLQKINAPRLSLASPLRPLPLASYSLGAVPAVSRTVALCARPLSLFRCPLLSPPVFLFPFAFAPLVSSAGPLWGALLSDHGRIRTSAAWIAAVSDPPVSRTQGLSWLLLPSCQLGFRLARFLSLFRVYLHSSPAWSQALSPNILLAYSFSALASGPVNLLPFCVSFRPRFS